MATYPNVNAANTVQGSAFKSDHCVTVRYL
ncbi:Uncharacterised protein [Klebsiella variicola]|nr:Uncharacterised protein [Klebsiella variicola]